MGDVIQVKADSANPTLEEQAKQMGIQVDELDNTATSQTAEKVETKEQKKAVEQNDKQPKDQENDDADPNDDDDLDGDDTGDEDEDTGDETDDNQDEDTDEEKAKKEVEKAGLNWEEVTQSYYDNEGELPEEQYEKLEKAGIPRAMADQFIEGQKAVVKLQQMEVFAEVGGEATYRQMTAWAADNWDAKQIAAFNNATGSRDMAEVMQAVRGLKAAYASKNAVEPSRQLKGGSRSNKVVSVYTSLADMKKDMADPRYKSDPVFRQKVEAKLARSNIL